MIAVGLDELREDLIRIKNTIKDGRTIRAMNIKRGNAYKKFMIDALENGRIPLAPIKKGDHPPLFDTGEFAEAMKVKAKASNVEVGYFSDQAGSHSRTGLSYYDIARLQTNGYRVGKTEVPPRPFMEIGSRMYDDEKIDSEIIKEYLDRYVL